MRANWMFTGTDEFGWEDGTIDVTATEKHVRVSITEEQAVDSHNQVFTCSVDLPLDKAAELGRLLMAAAESPPQP